MLKQLTASAAADIGGGTGRGRGSAGGCGRPTGGGRSRPDADVASVVGKEGVVQGHAVGGRRFRSCRRRRHQRRRRRRHLPRRRRRGRIARIQAPARPPRSPNGDSHPALVDAQEDGECPEEDSSFGSGLLQAHARKRDGARHDVGQGRRRRCRHWGGSRSRSWARPRRRSQRWRRRRSNDWAGHWARCWSATRGGGRQRCRLR